MTQDLLTRLKVVLHKLHRKASGKEPDSLGSGAAGLGLIWAFSIIIHYENLCLRALAVFKKPTKTPPQAQKPAST